MTRALMAGLVVALLAGAVGVGGAIDIGDVPEEVRSGVGPVHIGGAGDAAVPAVEVARADGATLVSIIRTLVEAGELTEEGVAEYCRESGVSDETLIRALDSIELSHPMKSPYLGLCELLWERLGGDIERCLELPYAPRIYMATYVAILGRTEDARRLVLSLPEDDPMRLSADIYHIANELAVYRKTAYDLAIWIWKRGATMRGPAEQAWVCRHIVIACANWSREDPGCWEREALPWIEEALARPGAEPRWGEAVLAVIHSYWAMGKPVAGIDEAMRLLEEVPAGGRSIPASQIAWAGLQTANAIMREKLSDHYQDAEVMLRQAIRAGERVVAQAAQYSLLRLAEDYPMTEPTIVLPPEVYKVTPEALVLRLGADGEAAELFVDGNATLYIEAVTSDLGCLEMVVAESAVPTKTPTDFVYRHTIKVRLTPGYAGDGGRGRITVITNSDGDAERSIPVVVEATHENP